MPIKFDDKQLLRFQSELKTLKSRALPFATKETVNTAAFGARKQAKRNVQRLMTLRNKRTLSGIRVKPTRTLRIDRQEAIVGTLDPWMEDQEFGSTRVAKGRSGRPQTTSQGSGEGDSARPRKRVARPRNALRNIRLSKRRRGFFRRASKQRAVVAVRMAQKRGTKHIFLAMRPSNTGIYKVTKRGIKLVQAMGQKTHVVPARPWLKPAVDKTRKFMPAIYRRALKKQLRRWGLFRG